MIKVYKTIGTTDSWMQTNSSPKLTIFITNELSTEPQKWFNREKKCLSFHREE